MLTQAHEDLRLECLRLASSGFNEFPGDTVKRAQAYFDFVTGKSDQSPRQVIEAALDKLEAKGA